MKRIIKNDRVWLYADDNKILTNGEVYATFIMLAVGQVGENYYEIPVAEYEAKLAAEAAEHGVIL